jgi:transposase
MTEIPKAVAKRIDHLGLVAGICKSIGLVEQIDNLLPKTRGDVKLSSGEAILAMILNGLGFKERRMYHVSKFFSDKSYEIIFGDEFELNFLNDDVLGRTLDAMEYMEKFIRHHPLFKISYKVRFILATNTKQDELPLEEILLKYHGQNKVESCFKFIKHKSFMAKDFYLKKPERIQALLVVMTLTLFIYSLGQLLLRQKLRTKKSPIDNQIGKPTFKPTLKWAFQILSGINWMRVEFQNKVATYLSELTKAQRLIIECFPDAKPFYGFG